MKYCKICFIYLALLVFSNLEAHSQVSDIDGNQYDTVIIGHQVWFRENLKTTKFSNGDSIPNDTNNYLWSELVEPSYCNFNNDSSYVLEYGRLYNWFSVSDPRNVCPTGWHVPTKDDWQILIDELGGSDSVKGKLNEEGNAHWIWSTGGATNSSGFTALPGGMRFGTSSSDPGRFNAIKMLCAFWTSTADPEYWDSKAFSHFFYPDDGGTYFLSVLKQYGLSVRCIRNTITSTNDFGGKDQFKIFPNPSSGILRIKFPEQERKGFEILIYSLNGDLVYKDINNSQINLFGLPKQVYVIKVIHPEYIYFGKLVLN